MIYLVFSVKYNFVNYAIHMENVMNVKLIIYSIEINVTINNVKKDNIV
jgi:hypothetical protein